MPLVGGLVPWRLAFVLFGAGGLAVAALLLLCREPQRQGSAQMATSLPGRAELAFLIAHRGVLVPLYLGFAVCFAVVYGAAAWTPAMLTRHFAATPAFFAGVLGPLSLVFAASGPLIGGWLLDRTMRAGKPLARFTVLALVPFCAIPAQLAVMAGSLPMAAALVASAGAAFAVLGIVTLATLQAVVPPRMRGAAVSLTLVLNTVIGATLGPLAVAAITERVIGDHAQVGWSIALFAVPCLLLGAGLYALARRNIARDRELVKLLSA
ncbi:MFS transporter [Novosphingobium sp. MW5]|nr:MFS transporter [Novosphingobium sp. MW5]